MSALIAAMVIGRPRIDPELSMSSDTTVSRNSMSRSVLKDSGCVGLVTTRDNRSEEHTSELQSLMRISYAVFCLKKKKNQQQNNIYTNHLHDKHQHHNTIHY